MRARVRLRNDVTLEGYRTLVADVTWPSSYPGCVRLERATGLSQYQRAGEDAPLKAEEVVVPLTSVEWILPESDPPEAGR